MRIGDDFFRLDSINIIHKPKQIYVDGTHKYCFVLICDSKTYNIFGYTSQKADEEKVVQQIYENLVKHVFPSSDEQEKKFI